MEIDKQDARWIVVVYQHRPKLKEANHRVSATYRPARCKKVDVPLGVIFPKHFRVEPSRESDVTKVGRSSIAPPVTLQDFKNLFDLRPDFGQGPNELWPGVILAEPLVAHRKTLSVCPTVKCLKEFLRLVSLPKQNRIRFRVSVPPENLVSI